MYFTKVKKRKLSSLGILNFPEHFEPHIFGERNDSFYSLELAAFSPSRLPVGRFPKATNSG